MNNSNYRLWPFLLLVLLTAVFAGIYYSYLRQPAPEGLSGMEEEKSRMIAPAVNGEKTSVDLFFASADCLALIAEPRVIPKNGDILTTCRFIIEELKKGPWGDLVPLIPVELEIRALFLADEILIIDLQPDIRGVSSGVLQESLIWYSVVNSIIMNVKEVGSVRFLVDGQEVDTILGHMDMKGEYAERLDLVRWY